MGSMNGVGEGGLGSMLAGMGGYGLLNAPGLQGMMGNPLFDRLRQMAAGMQAQQMQPQQGVPQTPPTGSMGRAGGGFRFDANDWTRGLSNQGGTSQMVRQVNSQGGAQGIRMGAPSDAFSWQSAMRQPGAVLNPDGGPVRLNRADWTQGQGIPQVMQQQTQQAQQMQQQQRAQAIAQQQLQIMQQQMQQTPPQQSGLVGQQAQIGNSPVWSPLLGEIFKAGPQGMQYAQQMAQATPPGSMAPPPMGGIPGMMSGMGLGQGGQVPQQGLGQMMGGMGGLPNMRMMAPGQQQPQQQQQMSMGSMMGGLAAGMAPGMMGGLLPGMYGGMFGG